MKRFFERVCVFGKSKQLPTTNMTDKITFVPKIDPTRPFDPHHISPTAVPPQADAFKKREMTQEELYIRNKEKEQRDVDRLKKDTKQTHDNQ